MDAMKMSASATCETGREGKGLMSMSEPVRASRSSCQPGKVARRRKVTKARMMATILWEGLVSKSFSWLYEDVNLQEVREDNGILERRGNPDQVQRVLVDVDTLRQRRGIVGAQEGAVGVCAETEVSHAHLELRLAYNVGDGGRHTRVDLGRVVIGRVVIVVEIDQENAGDERRG